MSRRSTKSATDDRSSDALRRTIADVRRSASLGRRMSLPNARRLYLRRAARDRRPADLARIDALYG